jgi:malate dehydrogenase
MMVEAIVHSSPEAFPASLIQDNEYGVTGMSISVPVYLSARGVTGVEVIDLSDSEMVALHESAEKIKELAESISIDS